MKKENKYLFRDVNIELTNNCNFNCLFCPNDIMTRKKGFMDFETAKIVIDDLSKNNITRLINFYLMGESLLHPEALKIFEYAFSKRFSIKLNTNASLINENLASKLLSYPKLRLFISYHTPYKESFERYRRTKSINFKGWEKNIKNLIKMKYETKSSTPITFLLLKTSKNFSEELRGDIQMVTNNKEAKEIINRWKKFTRNLIPEPKKINPNLELSADLKGKINFFLKKINRLNCTELISPGINFTVLKVHSWSNSAKDGKNNNFRPAFFGSCEALRDTISVLWNGDYTLCCADFDGSLVQGNVKENSISSFLDGDRAKGIISSFKRNRLPFKKCKNCRGASGFYNWVFNQVHSSLFYNFALYRKVRKWLTLDTK